MVSTNPRKERNMTHGEVAKYLTTQYNELAKGKSGWHPDRVFVSQELFDVYSSGITAVRYDTETKEISEASLGKVLAFKTSKMEPVKSLKGYEVVMGKVLKNGN